MTFADRLKKVQTATSAADLAPDTRTDAQKIIEGIGTGGYEAANSILMGLPDFLINNIGGSAAKKTIDELRRKNKEAAAVGQVGGLVGSMFIPGGAIVKGLGGAAKAAGAAGTAAKLGKAAEWMGGAGKAAETLGGRITQGVARGLSTSAEQVVPRTLISMGDSGKTAEEKQAELANLPTALALGAGVGGIMGPLASKWLSKGKSTAGETGPQKMVNDALEKFNDTTLRAVGIDNRGLKLATRGAGVGKKSANEALKNYKMEIGEIARSHGVNNSRDMENLIAKNNEDFQKIDDAFTAKAGPGWNKTLANRLKTDKEMFDEAAISGLPGTEKAAKDLLKVMEGTDNLPAMKQLLRNTINAGRTSSDINAQARGVAASKVLERLDEHVLNTSELPADFITDVKKVYKLSMPYKFQDYFDNIGLAKVSGGSPTFEKATLSALLGGGSAASSAAGDISQGQDIDVGKMATQGIAGAIGGAALNKALPAILNKATAAGGNIAAKAVFSPAGQKVANAVVKAAEAAPDNAPKAAAMISQQAAKDQHPEETAAKTEAAMAPEKVRQAKQEFSQQYADVFNARLSAVYNKDYAGMDPNEFMAQVAKGTNNFQDMPAMAEILYYGNKSKQKEFLQKYSAYLAMKDIDVGKATAKMGFLEQLPMFGGDKKAARTALIDNIARYTTGDDADKMRVEKKKIAKSIDELTDGTIDVETFANTYKLDFPDLQELGLA
jgi:hypothetical protein